MLHELVEYARSHGLAAEPGFKPKFVRWLLTFDEHGQFLGVTELGDVGSKKNKGRLFEACPDLTQPEMISAGAGSRHFLADNAEVVAKLTKKTEEGDLHKLGQQHRYFTARLRDAAANVPVLAAMADTLDADDSLARIADALNGHAAKPTDLVTLGLTEAGGGLRILLEENSWHDWWRSFRSRLAEQRNSGDEGQKMICLLSGQNVQPIATHPKIEGLADVGASSMGASLISFDKDCFRSFGLEQSTNAAMSEVMAATYRGALNHILREHSHRLAGARVAYWYTGEQTIVPEFDPIAHLIIGCPDDTDGEKDDLPSPAQRRMAEGQALSSVGRLLDAVRAGKRPELAQARFCALTLSGNAGRVVVRDWMEGSFEQLLANVNAWFSDLTIVARDGVNVVNSHKLMALLGATVRDLNDVPAPMTAAIWRVAVLDQPIPDCAAAQALGRLRVDIINDNPVPHPRVALLKAYLIRQGDSQMTPYLNENHPEPAYHCGRLMAVLADIQYRALGDVGASVVQRYYAAASATPALILGRLVRTAQFHLDKIDPGLRHWHEQRLANIWSRVQIDIPTTLNLRQQTLFAMGYYQQKAQRGSKAGSDETTDSAA